MLWTGTWYCRNWSVTVCLWTGCDDDERPLDFDGEVIEGRRDETGLDLAEDTPAALSNVMVGDRLAPGVKAADLEEAVADCFDNTLLFFEATVWCDEAPLEAFEATEEGRGE